jgi:hypothetical protein
MLPIILVAQLNTTPATESQSLQPLILTPRSLEERSQPETRTEYLQKQQQLLNQRQQEYQQGLVRLEKNSLPSRVGCSPLFPPVADYPAGTSGMSCSRP